MSSLSQRLHLGVQQKQILTPGLVQMVTVLQLNRMELKDMILNEIAENPVLEEAAEAGEELTPAEVQALLERERQADPADQAILANVDSQESSLQALDSFPEGDASAPATQPDGAADIAVATATTEEAAKSETDPFDEIDFGSFFDDYLDPGFKSPAAEPVDKPSFETFLSSPVTLSDHLQGQLSVLVLPEGERQAANSIIGNLEESGYLTTPLEEIAVAEGLPLEDVQAALKAVQSLDPTGVGATTLRECMLLQLDARGSRDSVAWKIVQDHLKLLETHQTSQLAKALGRPPEHIQIAVNVIRHLDPAPGLRYSSAGARQVEPDVHISKDGDDYVITLNEDEIPLLRLNGEYKRMIDREQEPNKDVRNYVKERYASALQLIKNIEQRKQTILRVCQSIVHRQVEFLEFGIDHLKPMMIKEVAEEIGVHPSTVSRAVAAKYAHTPQGVFELRYFFSEAVQGPSGSATPLLIVKRRVKKMIEEENTSHPLTDEQITARLQAEGIQVTRRTVAKYREDMKIPSTHQRRVRA
ncbi:MAG: RNA polymerase factor sigma-54 [Acidobacteriaceae bacterium]|nr:RNA polymerase factor sigma-54 [Acidobacteriaceae bacterium]MBV9779918.1 RNA polymerase factor sigma-54 [Acidobacteriaceae bacterium]